MIGETILHYKILEKLGEGGMGEVFKAQDTKLDRFVALKFLPSHFTSTSEEKERFIQEAKAASSMNHPNVCTIHDIQEHNGQLFIVMEYIDGVTLRDNKQNLSEKRILEIAAQVADGLGAAHEKGIVHRDIKPENIMIRKDGITQIMDFGLAKLYSDKNVSRLTKAGTTLGTMGYMSPEQVQGLDTDHRTDIFSFGVVLYEYLAGESPFKGMHETAILYEIVNVDPQPISTLKEGINPELDQLILECLEKDRDERFQSAKELARSLRKLKRGSTGNRTSRVYNVNSSAMNSHSFQNTQAHTSKSIGEMQVKNLAKNIIYNPKLFWGFSVLCFAAILLLLFLFVFNQTEIILPSTISTILPPEKAAYKNDLGSNLAISPDGKSIAYVAVDSTGNHLLYVRPINSETARVVADITSSAYPFWSPDSKFIGFYFQRKLLKVSLESGTILPICETINFRGGSWGKNDIIVFAPNSNGGLYKVPSSGGKPELLISTIDTTDNNWSLRWPFFLPDGETFLYLNGWYGEDTKEEQGIYIASIDGKLNKKISSEKSNTQYANGYMFYVSQSILLAQQLDLDDMKLTGPVQPIAKDLQYYNLRNSGTFSVSNIGNLIYQKVHDTEQDAAFVDKDGNIIKKLFSKRISWNAELSPGEEKITFESIDDVEQGNLDIWTYDISRNVTTRLTFDKAGDWSPLWSRDGKKIFFTSSRDSTSLSIFVKSSDGYGKAEKIFDLAGITLNITDISKDSKLFSVNVLNRERKTGWDSYIINFSEDKKTLIKLDTKYNERGVKFSPNQKWFLYYSDESGRNEIYVSPLDGSNGKWQISVNGGFRAKWMDNGKKIYYLTRDDKIYAVDLNENNLSISPGQPYLVFSTTNNGIGRIFDISIDGKKFLVEIPKGTKNTTPFTFITNWKEIVEQKK